MKRGYVLDCKLRRCLRLFLFWLAATQAAALLPAADRVYPVKIGASHRYLVDHNNTPY